MSPSAPPEPRKRRLALGMYLSKRAHLFLRLDPSPVEPWANHGSFAEIFNRNFSWRGQVHRLTARRVVATSTHHKTGSGIQRLPLPRPDGLLSKQKTRNPSWLMCECGHSQSRLFAWPDVPPSRARRPDAYDHTAPQRWDLERIPRRMTADGCLSRENTTLASV